MAIARVGIVLLGLFLIAAGGSALAQVSDEITALHNQVLRLHDQGKYAEAIEIAKKALHLAERQFGAEHPEVAVTLNNLAELYRKQGRNSEAEPLLKRTVSIFETAKGFDHSDVGTALHNLAALYWNQGRYREAEPLNKRSLAISEKALGHDHPDVGDAVNNLALLYDLLGRYAEVEPLLLRSLGLREKTLGADHPDVGTSLNNLALFYARQSRTGEAESLYKRSLALREKALGPDHPDVGQSLNNLAELYRDQGRNAEAEPLLKRSLHLREMALGPHHPDVGASLNNLAMLYEGQGRYAEMEPFLKRSIQISERALGTDHPSVGTSLNNLAWLYDFQGRFVEAEPLFHRSLGIREKALGPDHPDVAISLNNLAELYRKQGLYSEAEPLYKRSLAIVERALGAEHPTFGNSLNNLAGLYREQGRYAEAEPLMKRSLSLREKALGADHPDVGNSLRNLGALYSVQRDWARAAEFWRQSVAFAWRWAQRATAIAKPQSSSKGKSDALQRWYQFYGLIKTLHRLAHDQLGNTAEAFTTAQWAQGSAAAASLAQMAARGAAGSPGLAVIVRERQDLASEWQQRDDQRTAAVSRPPDKRQPQAEAANVARLAEIDARIAAIDTRLKVEFPDYAALASPEPLSVAQVQADLRPDEALVLFLDTSAWTPTPEETFVWVVTKTDVRWLRSDLGTPALTRAVAALRCGLDAATWWEKDTPCPDLTGVSITEADHAAGKPLPFDLARAHALYKGLLGEAVDLIKGKHLLVVPSGPLTRLPFQTLVTALPTGVTAGEIPREVGRLGAELGPLSDADRKSLPSGTVDGVRVVKPVPGGPAEAAGLRAGDVLLAVEQRGFATVQEAIATIQAAGPGRAVTLSILRDGQPQSLAATLGTFRVTDWKPLLLDAGNASQAAWLIRDHAITVLPSVAALASLRRTGKTSAASKPMIGFGNPLLEGDPNDSDERLRARYARTRTGCAATPGERTAALRRVKRSATPTQQAAGMADIAELRGAAPLPETADELCDVARSIGADPDDVHIGRRATESEIKRLSANGDLARYRIVHFATHGTLAGEIRGTREPGLILTPPDTATAADDGYLSGSEIAGLKLDADWVILSACNTAGAAGSAQGSAAEALSGLARVFFYAGARALLVSHWEVDSDAAVKLITTAIGAIAKDKSLGRAEALRRATLAVMADTARPANWVPAYHPAVWAPFVVVGEGAAAR